MSNITFLFSFPLSVLKYFLAEIKNETSEIKQTTDPIVI
jgi:hypothetical protein